MALFVQNSVLPLSDIKEFAIKPPLVEEMDSNDDYRISSAPADTGSPDCRQSVAVTGSKSTTFTSSSHSERSTGCSSLSSSTVFVAAPAGGTAPRHYESGPLSTVQPAPRHGHVVTIRINPETASDNRILNGNSSPPNNDTQCDVKKQNSKVSINQTDTINTIGKFIVNICESSDQTDSSDPIKEQYRANGCVRISVNPEAKRQDMVQKPETILKTNGEMASPYFFCSSFPCSPSNTLMSSGQCSPSDTLDSGTCSDLDGTPPPLPKKKSSKTNGTTHKRVSVTVIGATAHNRAPSVTSSGAEVDSEDSESNISCDSLNSSDLSSASLHEDTAAIAFKAGDKDKLQSDVAIPAAPKMPTLTNGNGNSSGFLPQGLLRDIRDRSAKLNAIQTEETKTSWAELDKQTEAPVAQIEPPIKIEESLTSFKLVSQVNGEAKKSKITDILSTQPIIIDTTPSYTKILPIVNESTYEDRKIQQEKQKQEKHFSYNFLYDTDKYYNFHLNENVFEDDTSEADKKKKKKSVLSVNGAVFNGSSDSEFFDEDSSEYFAGFKDYKNDDAPSTIRSAKGTIRGVKNRVRAGIKTFLQMQDTTAKSYREKDAGKVVVYTTSMGIVRGTYQKCLQVKKILRTLLVKFEERDVFMSGEYQEEIKERMRSSEILVPQIYVDGQHVGDAETIERLNECGELRRMLKPYKSADACTTCQFCGGYRLLPCPVCSGSKKSVHRNHFTAEFVALKCMNCDEVGLVKCEAC